MRTRLLLALLTTLGCGAEPSTGPGPGPDGGADAVASDRPPSGTTGRVRVTVTYAGRVMPNAQLQLSASRERMSASFPDSFAVVKDPVFPASGELVFATAGSYWITAVLNATPVEARPGAEDQVVVSMAPVEVRVGATTEVALVLLDRDS